MASPAEIGHSRHRQQLSSELRFVVEEFARQQGWSLIEGGALLKAYDGHILGHTIRDQSLQSYWGWEDGTWLKIDLASTGDAWDALVIITSSGSDETTLVPQESDSTKAIDAIESVLKCLKKC
jgi:hypothetical protein